MMLGSIKICSRDLTLHQHMLPTCVNTEANSGSQVEAFASFKEEASTGSAFRGARILIQ